jgi:uncharacterized protein
MYRSSSAILQPASVITDRIHSLDSLRGFALLGILLMNIQSFAMPEAAYTNPTTYGDFTGINKIIWLISHLFADSKFITLFSMLFGIGTLLFTQRLEARGLNSFKLHYRRMFWLLIFGLIHAHLIWFGDILYHYAVFGFLIYFARHWSAQRLMTVGLLLLFIGWALSQFPQWLINHADMNLISELQLTWTPSAQLMAREIADYTGNWTTQFARRNESALYMETYVLLYMAWRIIGLMLIGMSLYKQGIFTGQVSPDSLKKNSLIWLLTGFTIVSYGAGYNLQHHFQLQFSYFNGPQFNYIGSVFMALGYIYLFVWLQHHPAFSIISNRLAMVGRMAFSNYIAQSLICTFIFYGFGLGLFGAVERWQQLLIVVAIWLIQINLSSLWLKKHRLGPLEAVWRRLTYGRTQP